MKTSVKVVNVFIKSVSIILIVVPAACQKSVTPPQEQDNPVSYEKVPQAIAITGGAVKEASGIADSKNNPGNLWVEEDSGNPPQLTLLGHDGKINKILPIEGATNRDWEDIVLSNGPEAGKHYLYIGDIGDNDAKNADYTFYRFEEPSAGDAKVTIYDRIVFQYEDGAHDAEAFLVDGVSKDIYVITKRDVKSRIYKLAYPQSASAMNQAVFVAELPYAGAVSAALAENGKELIVKTYTGLNYYTRKEGESLEQTLQGQATTLGYQLEPQGEAISFAVDNSGFYTLGEAAFGMVPTLNFYKRN